MCVVNKIEYRIVPTEPFRIVRNCGGCGRKQVFACKNRFRVNANGNQLDVWLIYGCESCGHTYNLSIYERIRPDRIPKEEYEKFLSNDETAVYFYGTNKGLFAANRAEILWDKVTYSCEKVNSKEWEQLQNEESIRKMIVNNPCGIPLRGDRLLSEIRGISRNKAKQLIEAEKVLIEIV